MRKLILAALVASVPVTVSASPQLVREAMPVLCGKTKEIFEHLEARYGEQRHAFGISPVGMVNVWGNMATQTFTITISNDKGQSCVMASGQAFDVLAVKPEGDNT